MLDIPLSQLMIETPQKISQYMDLPRPSRKPFNLQASHLRKIAVINARDMGRIMSPKIVENRIGIEGVNHTINSEIDKIKINKIIEYTLVLIFPFEPSINLFFRHIQEMINTNMKDIIIRITLKEVEKLVGGVGINGKILTSLLGFTLNNIRLKVNNKTTCLAISSFIEKLFLSSIINL